MKLTPISKLVFIVIASAILGSSLVGCGDSKKDEDVAAIRKLMEDKKAEEEEHKRKDAEGMAELKRKSEETRKQMGIGK